ncbi:MAG: Tol biopolymer transport system component [Bacteroidia bacterium]|jgi:Tol biopolymer transport system component
MNKQFNRFLKISAFSFLLLCLPILHSCSIQEAIVAYDIKQALVSVPEEGGIKFTQHSQAGDNIVGPIVKENSNTDNKVLEWYAAPLIALSPNGKSMAYLAENNDFSNLFIKELRGGNKKVQRTFNKDVYDMSFSPDGKKLAFTEHNGSNTDIKIISSEGGSATRQIAATRGNEVGPIFSKDGKFVYFAANDGGAYYVWNVELDNGIKTQFSEGFTPVMLADGINMLVTRNNKTTGIGEIWMLDLDKGSETLILSNPEQGFSSPALSPDGKTIACVGTSPKSKNRPQNLDIFTVKLDGTKLTQITFHGGHDVSPIWSNDAKSIYMLAQRANKEGKYNIWQMNVENAL